MRRHSLCIDVVEWEFRRLRVEHRAYRDEKYVFLTNRVFLSYGASIVENYDANKGIFILRCSRQFCVQVQATIQLVQEVEDIDTHLITVDLSGNYRNIQERYNKLLS